MNGYGGCNQISGTYLIKGDIFLFNRALATRVACDHGMERENQLLQVLDETETYRVKGNTLQLFDQNERVRAQFIAGP
jgi:heat shock protein HslJ